MHRLHRPSFAAAFMRLSASTVTRSPTYRRHAAHCVRPGFGRFFPHRVHNPSDRFSYRHNRLRSAIVIPSKPAFFRGTRA